MSLGAATSNRDYQAKTPEAVKMTVLVVNVWLGGTATNASAPIAEKFRVKPLEPVTRRQPLQLPEPVERPSSLRIKKPYRLQPPSIRYAHNRHSQSGATTLRRNHCLRLTSPRISARNCFRSDGGRGLPSSAPLLLTVTMQRPALRTP